jgi:hypothetical protein
MIHDNMICKYDTKTKKQRLNYKEKAKLEYINQSFPPYSKKENKLQASLPSEQTRLGQVVG